MSSGKRISPKGIEKYSCFFVLVCCKMVHFPFGLLLAHFLQTGLAMNKGRFADIFPRKQEHDEEDRLLYELPYMICAESYKSHLFMLPGSSLR